MSETCVSWRVVYCTSFAKKTEYYGNTHKKAACLGHAPRVSENCVVRKSTQGVSFRTAEEQKLCGRLDLELASHSSR
jgi:hypothetical protein